MIRKAYQDALRRRCRRSATRSAPTWWRSSTATRPASRFIEPLLYFKGFHAIQTHRLAHWLWRQGRRDFALYLQSRSSAVFQVDINPAARIGRGIFLDHATGLVVGETAVIEDDVSILQGVTLGGTGKENGDRHPKIRPRRADRRRREDSRQYRGRPLRAGRRRLGRAEAGAEQRDGRRRAGAGGRRGRLRRAGPHHGPDAQWWRIIRPNRVWCGEFEFAASFAASPSQEFQIHKPHSKSGRCSAPYASEIRMRGGRKVMRTSETEH